VTFVALSPEDEKLAVSTGLEPARTVRRAMTSQTTGQSDGALLLAEIERYLVAVETFRAEGREPQWVAEALLEMSLGPRRRRTRARTA
jgi:hypothetical protein